MATNAPVTEIGYTQAPTYSWWNNQDETTPELVWPQSVYVYDQMRRTDSQVGSVLRAVTETLLRTPWRIDPAGARARVTKFVADDLGLPIVGKPAAPPPRLKDRFSWPSHLREALLMLPMGHAYFEQVYRPTDDGSAMHLRKLAYRPAKTIERIDVASDGGLMAIKQYWTATNSEPQPIPVTRLVAYIHAKEGGNWLGTSILRNCYKNWLLKDRLLRVQAQTIERNGMGIPLYTAAETETDLTAGLGMATSWRAGEAAGSAVPFGASLKLVGVEGTLPDALPVIEYHDAQIARAVLAHFLNLGQQTGSWALGTTFADFFTMSLQTLAEQIRDTATQHIVEDLVDINFGENEPAPRLVFDEIGSRQAATAAALKTLVDAGILHPDQVLEESSRQQYGLPPADPATATPPPGAAAATPPEPTQMGDTSPSVAAKSAPKGRAVADDGLFPLPKRQVRTRRKGKPVRARYNPAQMRDPNGEWGDGMPGPGLPDLDMEGFDLTSEVEGTFGTLQMGVDELGDVRMAWHEGYEARAVDLGDNELADLEPILHRLARYRDYELPDDAESDGVYDDDRFGYDNGHKVELLGNGVISITFGADEPDPYTLNLDPPDPEDGTDDVQDVLQATDDALTEANLRTEGDTVTAAAGVDAHPGGEQLKHYWVYGEGAAKWATWTELYHHLVKYLSAGMAKRTAAAWFHLRFGYWPGDHRNNVHASADVEADEWEEAIAALVAALAELAGEVLAGAFDEAKHPRGPGGKFRSTVDKLKSAIQAHRSSGGKGDPFDGFDREQLRRAAKTSGISLGRGEDRDSIAKKLLSHLDKGDAKPAAPKAPDKKSAPRKRVDPMTKMTDEQLVNGVKMHGSEDGHGKKAADELKRRGLDLDGKPVAESKLEEPKPVKKAPAKRAPRKNTEPKRQAPAKAAKPNRVAGRDLIGAGDTELARQVAADNGSYKSADTKLASIAAKQGFDGPPRVVSQSEMDRLVGDQQPLYRGVYGHSGMSAAAIHEQTRTGDAWYGNGLFGNGIYFATNEEKTQYYSDRTKNSILRGVLDPDANVVSLDDLKKIISAYDRKMEDDDPRWPVFNDPGRHAAALGYDAIRVPLAQGEGGDQVVVLNRTALILEEAA